MHTTGGYLTGVTTTHHFVFDIKPRQRCLLVRRRHRLGDRPQLHRLRPAVQRAPRRCSTKGTPDFPDKDRWWEIVERYDVTILYTAPTAIRTLHEVGRRVRAAARPVVRCACSARSASRSIPEAWIWYHEHIGGGRCPIVDTWWQTETGVIMITPLPGVTTPSRAPRRSRSRASAPTCLRRRANRCARRRRLPRAHPAVARRCCAASGQASRALCRDVLVAVRRRLLRRRRRADRRRRRLLAARPHRRRDERLRPPHLDDRGRVRAGRPPDVAEAAVAGAPTK